METKEVQVSFNLVDTELKWKGKDGDVNIKDMTLKEAKTTLKVINKRLKDYGKLIVLHKLLQSEVEQHILTYPRLVNSINEIKESGKYRLETKNEIMIIEATDLKSFKDSLAPMFKDVKLYELQEV